MVSRNKILILVIENLALMAIGVVLVVGFWYHSLFYQVYAPLLFVIGAGLIVLMIWTIVFIRKDRKPGHNAKGVIIFEPQEKDLVEKGQKTAVIFKDHLDDYHQNEVYHAKINITSKKDFAVVLLKKKFHIELSDLTIKDIVKLGFEDEKGFKQYWAGKFGKYKKGQEATLIEFSIMEGK